VLSIEAGGFVTTHDDNYTYYDNYLGYNSGSKRYHERAGSPRKVNLGVVFNPRFRNPFKETLRCYTLVSTSTKAN
jgi:hypothetical protein